MKDTVYTNPHGMDENNNRSTAQDQAILTSFCLRNDFFVQIVSSISYECEIYNNKTNAIKKYKWVNTN